MYMVFNGLTPFRYGYLLERYENSLIIEQKTEGHPFVYSVNQVATCIIRS